MTNTFVQWLIGFLEGDGNFQTVKKARKNGQGVLTHYGVGYAVHIGLSLVDLALLQHIQQVLGMGNINTYPNKDKTGEAHYAITKMGDVALLLEIISQYPMLTSYQRMRKELVQLGLQNKVFRFDTNDAYNLWKDSLVQQPTVFDNLEPGYVKNWVVGLINAEGHFMTNQSGFMLEHTDQAVLVFIAKFLGLSRVVTSTNLRPGRKPTFLLSITNSVDRSKLIDLLNNNAPLLGNKSTQYQAWLTRLPVSERNSLSSND